jgi:acetolactate synthase-1/2/3 large subunit
MRCNGAEIIVRILKQAGINIVTGIPGGANLPLYDALYHSRIRHILARHEQAAGFIAQGIARSTGKPAVCFATSGPGATNLVTAIADAKLDSIPLIAITGQVATSLIGTDAFQEVDTYCMMAPITKHNFLVKSPGELLSALPRALAIATSGRPGPVVVDVPRDVQLQEIEVSSWPEMDARAPLVPASLSGIEEAARLIDSARKPVLYAGGGIASSESHSLLRELARKNSIPVAMTLMGLGCYPPGDDLYLGMLGMHGLPSTNMILHETDLLLAFGVRFDDRATGRIGEFCPRATIIHADIDEAEINKIRKAHLSLVGDAKNILERLVPMVRKDTRSDWMGTVGQIKVRYPLAIPENNGSMHPMRLIMLVQSLAPRDTIVTTDVGQHQMWVAQAYRFERPRSLLTSSGLGTMGFGLPAAVGASLANPGRRVLCVTGDGSLQMNIQELATLAELGLPVTILVMNNGHLGLVRQQQELFYEARYIASRFNTRLNFAGIAKEFGIPACRIGPGENPKALLEHALSLKGPCLVDVEIHHMEKVLPMVAPGAGNINMIGVDPSEGLLRCGIDLP